MSQRSGDSDFKFGGFYGLNGINNSNTGYSQNPASPAMYNNTWRSADFQVPARLNVPKEQEKVNFPLNGPISPLPQLGTERYSDHDEKSGGYGAGNANANGGLGRSLSGNGGNGDRYEDVSPNGTKTAFSLFPKVKEDKLGKQNEARNF